jgi:hypothetical protein
MYHQYSMDRRAAVGFAIALTLPLAACWAGDAPRQEEKTVDMFEAIQQGDVEQAEERGRNGRTTTTTNRPEAKP